jgi:hypothetical protein
MQGLAQHTVSQDTALALFTGSLKPRYALVLLLPLYSSVAAFVTSDVSPPEPKEFSVDTSSVDVKLGPAAIHITAHITDDLSGIGLRSATRSGAASATFVSPSRTQRTSVYLGRRSVLRGQNSVG